MNVRKHHIVDHFGSERFTFGTVCEHFFERFYTPNLAFICTGTVEMILVKARKRCGAADLIKECRITSVSKLHLFVHYKTVLPFFVCGTSGYKRFISERAKRRSVVAEAVVITVIIAVDIDTADLIADLAVIIGIDVDKLSVCVKGNSAAH